MGRLVTSTRKIQLLINEADNEKFKEHWQSLFAWQRLGSNAANLVASHLFFTHNIQSLLYLDHSVKIRLEKVDPEKIGVVGEEQVLTTSVQNAFYQMLSYKFKGSIPMAIASAINNNVYKTFSAEFTEMMTGQRSLRTYRNTMPLPFPAASITDLTEIEEEYLNKMRKTFAFTLFKVPFKMIFSKDLYNTRGLVEKSFSKQFLPDWVRDMEPALSEMLLKEVNFENLPERNTSFKTKIAGKDVKIEIRVEQEEPAPEIPEPEPSADGKPAKKPKRKRKPVRKKRDKAEVYVTVEDYTFKMWPAKEAKKDIWRITSDVKFCDSSIQIKKVGDKYKIFLLAVFQQEKEKPELDIDKIMYATLDVRVPIVAWYGGKTYPIGSGEGFYYRRQQIQMTMRKMQKALIEGKAQKGRAHKLRGLNHLESVEKKYVTTKIHTYSKKLIDLALEFGCKTIVLRNQKEKEEKAKKDEFLLRNWSYFDMKKFIEYKAERVNILIVTE